MPIDRLAMALAMDPTAFDVLLLQNLYGDIISDVCAGLVGAWAWSLVQTSERKSQCSRPCTEQLPTSLAKASQTHWPYSLSGAMMLEHIGQHKVAQRVNQAIWEVLEEGKCLTGDLGGSANTEEFTQALIDKL